MGKTLGTMLTISTYGTWMRGDNRGWVEDGVVYPAQPELLKYDHENMKHPPYRFDPNDWFDVGHAIGESLTSRMSMRVYSLTVQLWHTHVMIGPTRQDIADIVKCIKDAARWQLRIDRPIWGAGYDKRWCFDARSLLARINYVDRHNLQNGWIANPWPFLVDPPKDVLPYFCRLGS